jgi:hypothetical protein
MKLVQLLFPILMILFISCSDVGVGPTATDTGTVFYNSVEGGSWGIQADNGINYRVSRLPEEFRVEGLRVEFFGLTNNQPSTHMWGIGLELVSIKKAS